MATRKYEQRLRAASADDTRRRILDAVFEQLRGSLVQSLNVDSVAKAAGVARSTVYVVFGSRAGLFEAFGDYLFERIGFRRITEAVEHPDAREHLRGALRASSEVYAAERDAVRVLFSVGSMDPDAVGGLAESSQHGRLGGMEYLAGRLAEQGYLRDDLTYAEAVDLLFVLTSFDAFDQLYHGRGLTPPQVAERLITMAERTLLRDGFRDAKAPSAS